MAATLQIKAAVRERDGFRCVECGMTNAQHVEKTEKQLEVHRKTPGSPYTLDGCVTLCRTCHGPQPKSPPSCGQSLRKKRPTVALSVTVPATTRRRLDRLIEARSRKLNAEVQIAIDRYLDEEEPKEKDLPPLDDAEEAE